MNDILEFLGIDETDCYRDSSGYLHYDIPDSNSYGKLFSKLDSNDDFDSSDSLIQGDNVVLKYETSDDDQTYELDLIMNLEKDSYKIIIKD